MRPASSARRTGEQWCVINSCNPARGIEHWISKKSWSERWHIRD